MGDQRGRILRREMRNHLLHFILEQRKVLFLKPGDDAPAAIGDGHGDEHQVRVHQDGDGAGVGVL